MKKIPLVFTLLALLPAAAFAQSPVVSGAGPRVGFSTDPDQLVFGTAPNGKIVALYGRT